MGIPNREGFLDVVSDLLQAEHNLLSYFGYEHDWRVFPVELKLDMYWALDEPTLHYSPKPLTAESMEAGTDTSRRASGGVPTLRWCSLIHSVTTTFFS